jgi:hypothetical protein
MFVSYPIKETNSNDTKTNVNFQRTLYIIQITYDLKSKQKSFNYEFNLKNYEKKLENRELNSLLIS